MSNNHTLHLRLRTILAVNGGDRFYTATRQYCVLIAGMSPIRSYEEIVEFTIQLLTDGVTKKEAITKMNEFAGIL